MRGPWSHAKPEIYLRRSDLLDILDLAWCHADSNGIRGAALVDKVIQVIEQGGSLVVIEDNYKTQSGDSSSTYTIK